MKGDPLSSFIIPPRTVIPQVSLDPANKQRDDDCHGVMKVADTGSFMTVSSE
ncbi:hypothetical protein OZD70_00160 [Wolbachia endosymbiont of Drosophila tsacasi]|nr:hypothetical protein [Wolbachia endosymbiont of Drosophila tsacasi]